MSDRPAGVLFISHDAWRTGAPLVLLHFLRWLKQHSTIPFVVLLREGAGELRPEFEHLAPVYAWNELLARESSAEGRKGRARLLDRLTGRARRAGSRTPSAREGLDHLLRDGNVGLVYSNTITNGEVLASMAGGLPVITHVHELGFWINHRLDPGSLAHTRRLTSLYVAVSDAVRQNLIDGLGIPPQMVETIHEFIPTHVSSTGVAREEVRAALGIPAHAFVVGGSGTTDWRKGPDLFVQLAAVVRRRRPQEPVHFVWIGGEDRGPTFAELWHDVVHAHAADVVHFVGRQPNSLQYFAALDAFAMTSREDPFPLVCLEAALLEKPIVCFEGSGGAAEFVGNDAGIVVPYLDLHGMGEAILRLMDSEQLRRRLGRQGAEKVRRRHDVGVAAPRLLALIRRYVSEAAPDRNGRP